MIYKEVRTHLNRVTSNCPDLPSSHARHTEQCVLLSTNKLNHRLNTVLLHVTVESFKGEGWFECAAFIRGIRAVAQEEGKLQDAAWMANLASTYLLDEALEWYSHFSPDVKENLDKLQAALIDRWSLSGDRFQSVIPSSRKNSLCCRTEDSPIAAGGPSLKGNSRQRGIIKALVPGETGPFYVKMLPDSSVCSLTEDPDLALRFYFDSPSGSRLFQCLVSLNLHYLAN